MILTCAIFRWPRDGVTLPIKVELLLNNIVMELRSPNYDNSMTLFSTIEALNNYLFVVLTYEILLPFSGIDHQDANYNYWLILVSFSLALSTCTIGIINIANL